MRRCINASGIVGAGVLFVILGCQTPKSAQPEQPEQPESGVLSSMPASIWIPHDVERLAVLHRTTIDRDEHEAYRRLEGAVFQLKELRPGLKIFERSDLSRIFEEQRFQLAGPVSEETAIHAGRLLGVDSVLIYEIQGPSLRDRFFADRSADLPPLVVSSKIIRVESAEVVFHNVVSASVDGSAGGPMGFGSRPAVQPLIREALARGVEQTISDLRWAFR